MTKNFAVFNCHLLLSITVDCHQLLSISNLIDFFTLRYIRILWYIARIVSGQAKEVKIRPQLVLLQLLNGRHNGLMINALDSGSSHLGFSAGLA